MACDKFESEGLLYCAGELTAEGSVQYEMHLAECSECAQEIAEYKQMFGGSTAKELLETAPSAECDTKIYAALEAEAVRQGKPVVSFGGIFTLFMQRVAIPAAIFMMAVTVGFQVSHNSTANQPALAKKTDTATVNKDSLNDTGRIFIQGGSNGVMPVNLEDK